ncbi:putative short-chain dehydrogenase reductase 5 [Iris pallida]|uniref:Noroxomaritidine/norcraugsodine reductase n=1 Tax=Iris pallida TaxID=29817 RepID=A0AAX6E3N1_IRIPA|nr:putative short-chain dehydrogenase reductase 5 [Iris pallida]
MTTLRLEGKVAIVTGAASGIGEAAARLFAANGATVVVADIQDRLGHEVVASIGPDKSIYVHCDVTDEEQVKAAVDHAVSAYGRLDIMYSNAGVLGSPFAGILDLDKQEMDRVMAVNVTGTAVAIKHAARAMVARGVRGSIVCTASVAAHQGGHGPAAYVASKHAVLGLVRAAAGELGQHGIRVNCVSPYGVATPMSSAASGLASEAVEGMFCAVANLKGVALRAGHVAEAALFLASEEAAYVSGHDLVVDGGNTAVYSALAQLMSSAGFNKSR